MEVKGTAVKSVRNYVVDNHKDSYPEWYQSLSQGAKEIVLNSLTNKWYPLQEGVIEPTQKIADLFFNGDVKKAAFESGMYSADIALHGIYKLYVKFSSPGHVVDRGSRILPAYYNPSEIKQILREKQLVRYEMSGSDEMNEVVEYRVAGWMYKALEVSGCKTMDVQIVESVKTHGRTVFEAKWS